MAKPLKDKSPVTIKRKITEYFKACDTDGRPYTVAGLALALDSDRDEVLSLFRTGQKETEIQEIVREALARCESYAEEQLLSGKNASAVIFYLKKNFPEIGERGDFEPENEPGLAGPLESEINRTRRQTSE